MSADFFSQLRRLVGVEQEVKQLQEKILQRPYDRDDPPEGAAVLLLRGLQTDLQSTKVRKVSFRPSSNKKLFPVHRPGGLKRAYWNLFFPSFKLLTPPPPPSVHSSLYKNKNEIRKNKKIPDWLFFCPPG